MSRYFLSITPRVILTFNSFVDRDMFMRYHWGLGVGHTYAHQPLKSAVSDHTDVPNEGDNSEDEGDGEDAWDGNGQSDSDNNYIDESESDTDSDSDNHSKISIETTGSRAIYGI